jgi:aldehyde dehydrogenase (NAD+)
MNVADVLDHLEIEPVNSGACDSDWIEHPGGDELASLNPADGCVIARVRMAGLNDYDRVAGRASQSFLQWRMMPAPKRGELVRERDDRRHGLRRGPFAPALWPYHA